MILGAEVDRNPLPTDLSQASAVRLRRPFFLSAEHAQAGVLLVHGFTGTPFEMRYVGEQLHRRGFTVYAPLLTGHGLTSEDLCGTTWRDWFRSVDEAATMFRAMVPRMFVVGLSLGGLLTLELARRRGPDLAAIVSLSAPLWFPQPVESMVRVSRWLGRKPKAIVPKGAGSDVSDPQMRGFNNLAHGTVGIPVAAVLSLREFMDQVRAGLPEIETPTLAMHGRQDHTAPFACLAALADELGTREVETFSLPRSFHVVTLDVERDLVVDRVHAHLVRHL